MKQVIIGGYNNALHATATEYNTLAGGGFWTATADNAKQVVSAPGTLSNLLVELEASPGNGTSYTITLMKNGVAQDLAVTISGTDTTGLDTRSVAVAAGDVIQLRCIPSGTPTARVARWSILFEGTNAKESLILGTCPAARTELPLYYPIMYGYYYYEISDEDNAYQIIPTPGKIKNLYVALSESPGTFPDAYRFTLRKNGENTALTCAVTAIGVSYYFNARGDAVWTDPDKIVDNNLGTFGYTSTNGAAQVLTGNTCPGTDLGPITKVELRLYGKGDGDDHIDITPIFSAGDGDPHETTPVVSPGGWSSYVDITNDTNHPDWSLWSHIQDLDCKLAFRKQAKANTVYCAKVEITVTYTSAEENTGNDTEHEITVAAGDYVDLLVEALEFPAVGPTAWFGFTFVADIDGESLLLGQSSNALDPAATEYNHLVSTAYNSAWSATEANFYQGGQPMTLKKLYVKLSAAPGAGKSYLIGARVNGSTKLSVTIADSETTGNNVIDTWDVANFDDLNMISVPSGAPTVVRAYWGLVTTEPWVPPVPDIDVGADATDRPYDRTSNYTYVDKNNPANASGILHSIKIWAETNITGLIVGTFYTTNGATLKCRDSVLIGDVEAGAERTFTDLSITVVEGDYIGCYYASGAIEVDFLGFAGIWRLVGEYIDPGDEATYALMADDAMSLYGYGDIVPPPEYIPRHSGTVGVLMI